MPDFDITIIDIPDDVRRTGSDAVSWALSSWLQSNRDNGMGCGHGAPFPVYWTMHERLAKRLIRSGRLLLAHLEGAPDVFVGWACADDRALHYVYVKKNFRQGGIATQLLDAVGVRGIATHAPAPQRQWLREVLRRRGCTISPYALIEGIHHDEDFTSAAATPSLREGRPARD